MSRSAQRPDLCNSMTLNSTLTAANVGVNCCALLLWPGDRGRKLRVLATVRSPAAVPFSCVYKRRRLATLQEIIAEAAMEISSFPGAWAPFPRKLMVTSRPPAPGRLASFGDEGDQAK